MAELIIRGDGGFENIPISDIGSPPDYSQIYGVPISTDWTGTLENPVYIWKSGNAYIKCAYYSDTHGGQNYRLEVNPLSGWTPSTTPPFYFDYGNIDTIYIGGCFTGSNGIVFLSNDGTFPKTDYLYYGTKTALEAQLEENREWDETPTEDNDDLNNENPRGGEYAQTGFFGDTDLMLVEDMPDPNDNEISLGGFVTCYCVDSVGNMSEWNECLFKTDFWTSLKNKFEGLSDPLTMILSAVQLPLNPWTLNVDGADEVMLGGIVVTKRDNASLVSRTFDQRYKKYSLGQIHLQEVWGSAKDYTDTSVSIYLPYVGVKEVDADIVINAYSELFLYIDKWTGDILYMLHVSNRLNAKKYYRQESVVYRWSGNCGRKMPIGRVDTSSSIMQMVAGIGSIGAGTVVGGMAGGIAQAGNFAMQAATSGFKPTVQSSGSVSGGVGQMDYQYAYFIIKRGVPEYPNNWRAEIGAPRNQTFELSALLNTGYTLFSHIQLGNMGDATEEEKAELERLLTTEGAIL